MSTDDKPDTVASTASQRLEAAAAACKTAEAYAAYGNWAAAKKILEQVLAQDERNEVAHYEMAIACTRLGDYQRANNEVNRAIQINPRYANAYLELGVIKTKLGDLTGAEKSYLKAIDLDPSLRGTATRGLDTLRRGKAN